MDKIDNGKAFLCQLAGKDGVKVDAAKDSIGTDDIKYFFHTADTASLTQAFMTDILTHIAPPLEGYTVKNFFIPTRSCKYQSRDA